MLRFKEYLKQDNQKAANNDSLFRSTRKNKPTLLKRKALNEKQRAKPDNEGIVSKQDLIKYIESRPEQTLFIKFTTDADLYIEFLEVQIGAD